MNENVDAGFFELWIDGIDGSEPLNTLESGLESLPSDFEFEHDGRRFRFTDWEWHPGRALSGVIYRVRSDQLPSLLTQDEVCELPIDEESDLGEPMCFALLPSDQLALVHYNHIGPRHSVLKGLLSHLGSEGAPMMVPVFTTEAMERLRAGKVIREAELGFQASDRTKEVLAVGGSAMHAMNILSDTGGIRVSIKISMYHDAGSLRVRDLFKKLVPLDDKGVTKLKLRTEDDKDLVNLLEDRMKTTISVPRTGRYLDVTACRKRLLRRLRDHRDRIITDDDR